MHVKDFFRPRRKTTSSKFGIEQIRREQDQDVLKKVLLESKDLNLQKTALHRITDISTLYSILENKEKLDEEIFKISAHHFEKKLVQHILDQEKKGQEVKELGQYLDYLNDESPLIELITLSENNLLKEQILPKINTSKGLYRLAKKQVGPQLGPKIIEQLEDQTYLEKLSREGSNKKIRRAAIEKIEKLYPELAAKNNEKSKDSSIIQSKKQEEELQYIDDVEKVLNELEAIALKQFRPPQFSWLEWKKDWEKLHLHRPNNPQSKEWDYRFTKALETIMMHREENISKKRPTKKVETIKKVEAVPEIKEIDEELLTKDMTHLSQSIQSDLSELSSHIHHKKFNALEHYYQEKLKRWSKMQRQLEQLDEQHPLNLQKASINEQLNELETLLKQTKENLEEEHKKHKSIEVKLSTICESLETLSKNDDRKGLDKKVKAFQEEWKKLSHDHAYLPKKLSQRYHQILSHFYKDQKKYWEEEEWKSWNFHNQLKELTTKAQELVLDTNMQGKGNKLYHLMEEWKKITSENHLSSHQFWKNFREQIDLGHEKCLQVKKEIYQELVSFLAPLADLKEINDEVAQNYNIPQYIEGVKNLQKKWRDVGPLPFSIEKTLMNQFRKKCNDFFDLVKTFNSLKDGQRNENYIMKSKVYDEVLKTIKISEDPFKTAGMLKRLQKEWKNIGPTPREQGDELWKKFKEACDGFFKGLEETKQTNFEQKKLLLDQYQSFIDEELPKIKSADQAQQQVNQFQDQWRSIGPVAREKEDELFERLDKLNTTFFEHKKSFEVKKLGHEKELYLKKTDLMHQVIQFAKKLYKEEGSHNSEMITSFEKIWSTDPLTTQEGNILNLAVINLLSNCHFENDQEGLDNNNNESDLIKKQELILKLSILCRLLFPEHNFTDLPQADMGEQIKWGQKYNSLLVIQNTPKETRKNILNKMIELQKKWNQLKDIPANQRELLWNQYIDLIEKLLK